MDLELLAAILFEAAKDFSFFCKFEDGLSAYFFLL